MNIPKPIIALFPLWFILFFACRKDNAGPDTKATEYFPNKVGDTWVYDVYDSSSPRSYPGPQNVPRNYTVTVSVIGTTKLFDDRDANIWQYSYPWGNDTSYVRLVGDTVKIYDTYHLTTLRDLQFPRNIFIVPFQDGRQWNGPLYNVDTYQASALQTVTTMAGTFTGAFNIYGYYLGPNTEYRDNYSFVPNVGMAKIYYNHYVFFTSIYSWRLRNYYLN